MTGRLPVVEVAGDRFVAGAIYGDATRPLIMKHLDLILESASKQGAQLEDLATRSRAYRAFVETSHPDLAEEVNGIARGASIGSDEAWLLQLRTEAVGLQLTPDPECTLFGASASTTESHSTLAGQNGDLPTGYRDLLVLVRRTPPDRPQHLTLTPAGQLAWHGMNENGVAVFANFLTPERIALGVPRYLYSRIALDSASAVEALQTLRGIKRASARHLLIADERNVVGVELGPDFFDEHVSQTGFLSHSNHYVYRDRPDQGPVDTRIENSKVRLERINNLLGELDGVLTVERAMSVLRDRASMPHPISIEPSDDARGWSTVASTIADVVARRLWIAVGPPHQSTYFSYEV